MRRNKDLIREILLYAESKNGGVQIGFSGKYGEAYSDDFPGIQQGDLSGHLKLLIDDEYLEGKYFKAEDGIIYSVSITSITMKGYDLIDSIRDTGIWAEVKSGLGLAGESWSLEMLTKLATKILAKKIGL